MLRLSILIIYTAMGTSAFGQIADLLQLKKSVGYAGELVSYTTDSENNTWVKGIYTSWRSERRVECRLDFDDGERSEYWTLNVDSLYQENGVLAANLSQISLDDATGWAYIDDKATATYTFNEIGKLVWLERTANARSKELVFQR